MLYPNSTSSWIPQFRSTAHSIECYSSGALVYKKDPFSHSCVIVVSALRRYGRRERVRNLYDGIWISATTWETYKTKWTISSQKLNVSVLRLLTITWNSLLLNCTNCAISWNTWQNVWVKCTATVCKHGDYRKVTKLCRRCWHDVRKRWNIIDTSAGAKTEKTKSMLILVT